MSFFLDRDGISVYGYRYRWVEGTKMTKWMQEIFDGTPEEAIATAKTIAPDDPYTVSAERSLTMVGGRNGQAMAKMYAVKAIRIARRNRGRAEA